MWVKRVLFVVLCVNISLGHTTQRPSRDDEGSPLLDLASTFIQQALNNQNDDRGSGPGLAATSLIGSFMQNGNGNGKSSGAAQILSGIGTLLASNSNAGGGNGGGGFDPSIIGNVIEMFTANSESDNNAAESRSAKTNNQGVNWDAILQVASVFMDMQQAASPPSSQKQKRSTNEQDNGLLSLLPMVMQAVSSFTGPEGQRTQEKHKNHAWALPPFLEQVHVLWDHFSNSDLADALYKKSGAHAIFQGFTGRDGKLDYDKLFESLNNQSFRRRWIKGATLYLADWAKYLADPDVYLKYFQTGHLMFNGFLKSQGYPKSTFFDQSRPSETISNLLDHVAKHHLSVKIDSRAYVKPAVAYTKELMKLGQARGLLQFNSTDLSEKLTDTLNLEVIEPVLKVHRAYRFVKKTPHCDKYVLCDMNSHDPNEKVGFGAGFKPKITKVCSLAAALAISTETGSPFWTLYNVINDPHNCEIKFPVDCTGFHEGEAKVTTEYIHNEL
ncbi:hypothetical protein ACFFRR_007056 [Megaselia abdita]